MSTVDMWLSELRDALDPQGLFARVDFARCRNALDRLESVLPDVIRQAQEIVNAKERILAGARAEAQRIVAEAETRAAHCVGESAVLARARQEARRVTDEARAQSDRVVADHARMAEDTLRSLAEYLDMLTRRTQDYAKRIAPSKR